MKNILYFLAILFVFSCTSNSNTDEKRMNDNDTISSCPKSPVSTIKETPITYDTTVIKSKKVKYNTSPEIMMMAISNTVPNTTITDSVTHHILPQQPQLILTKENRILRVVPNIEQTSKNITGRLNYVMDDTMEVGVINTVSVSISRNMSKKMVISKVSTFRRNNNVATEIIDTIIRVTPKMQVKLQEIGTVGNFHIDTITHMIQEVELNDTTLTLWQWEVTPLKDGNKMLTISVDLFINDVQKNLNIYNGYIYVHMKNKFWVTIGHFITSYWQWLCTAAIFPFLVWLFTTYILPIFRKNKN